MAVASGAFLGALTPGIVWPLDSGTLLTTCVAGAAVVVGMRVAAVGRWVALTVLAAALITSTLAARSWSGLDVLGERDISGRATLVTDPQRSGQSTVAVVRVSGRRYLARAHGPAGGALGRSQAGGHVEVEGRTRPYRGSRERKAALHVAEWLVVERAKPLDTRNPLWRVANATRGLIADGVGHFSIERRSLFTGIVYGDDRNQDPSTEVDFRLAGLTHLLAVSGQNVAYVLTVAGPLIQRRSPAGRWMATLSVLVLFAAATRFEPSVLRATAMAGIAVSARTLGREVDSGRLLALAVTALLIVDPLLAETVAFRLSVAASAGIVWLGPILRRRLRGPSWFRESMAVTLAAQLAVAPLLTATFGPVGVVSIPANLAAGPIAGLVMAWGMSAGLAAGVAGGWTAQGLHLPTSGALWLLEEVAAYAAAVPLAPVGLDWIACAVLTAMIGHRWRRFRAGAAMAGTIGLALCVALVPVRPLGAHRVGWESAVSVRADSIVLDLRAEHDPTRLLEDLSRLGIRSVDTIVVDGAGAPTVRLLLERLSVRAVVAEELTLHG